MCDFMCTLCEFLPAGGDFARGHLWQSFLWVRMAISDGLEVISLSFKNVFKKDGGPTCHTHDVCSPLLPPLLLSSPLAPVNLLYTIPCLLFYRALRLIISSRCLMVFNADALSSLAAAAEFDMEAIATNQYASYSNSSVGSHPSRIVGSSGKGSRSPSSSMADQKFTGSTSTGSSSSSGSRFVAWEERRRSIPPPPVVVWGRRTAVVAACRWHSLLSSSSSCRILLVAKLA